MTRAVARAVGARMHFARAHAHAREGYKRSGRTEMALLLVGVVAALTHEASSVWAAQAVAATDASRGFALLGESACVMRCVLVRVARGGGVSAAGALSGGDGGVSAGTALPTSSSSCCVEQTGLLQLTVHHVAFDGASTSSPRSTPVDAPSNAT